MKRWTNEPWFWRVFLVVLIVAAIIIPRDWHLPEWAFWPLWVLGLYFLLRPILRKRSERGL